MTFYLIWLAVGLIAVLPLLVFAEKLSDRGRLKLMGRSLIIAAIIYILFAWLWGNSNWMIIEIVGVILYGLFYWLAIRFSPYWLAAGWMLHPVWDVLLHLLGPGHEVVPAWYAVACVSFDIAAGIYILMRLPKSAIQQK